MSKINSIIGLFLLMVLFFNTSCSSRKKTVDGDKIKSMSTDKIVDSLIFHSFTAEWLRAKGDAELNFAGEKNKVKINLRVRKDSAIWCNISKAGIQIITTLFSEDSVKFLKKIGDKEYFNGTWEYLNKLLGLELNYQLVQDFIFGNAIAFDVEEKYKDKIQDHAYLLSSTKSKKIERILEKGKNTRQEILYRCWVDPFSFKCRQVELDLLSDSIRIKTGYGGWEEADGLLYPLNSTIEVSTPNDTIKIEMEYSSKIKLNEPQRFPFKITDSYEPFNVNE